MRDYGILGNVILIGGIVMLMFALSLDYFHIGKPGTGFAEIALGVIGFALCVVGWFVKDKDR